MSAATSNRLIESLIPARAVKNPSGKSFGIFVDGKSVDAPVRADVREERAQLEPIAQGIESAKREQDTHTTPERWYADEEQYLANCPLAVTKRDLEMTARDVLNSGVVKIQPLVRIFGHPEFPRGERLVYRPAHAELIQAGVFCHCCGSKQKDENTTGYCNPVDNPFTGLAVAPCGTPRGGILTSGNHGRLVQA